jgi:3-hydroxyacyl-[acyl-carrier-protein] dehydratase
MAIKADINSTVFDILQIQEILPQRFPFLMIDRVIKTDKKAQKVTCVKNVSANEHFFEGHFPQNPIMPGALIIEAMAQASIIAYAVMKPELAKEQPSYLLGKIEANFKKPVIPGNQLVIKVCIIKLLDTAGLVQASVKVEDETVAEAKISFGVRFKHE